MFDMSVRVESDQCELPRYIYLTFFQSFNNQNCFAIIVNGTKRHSKFSYDI